MGDAWSGAPQAVALVFCFPPQWPRRRRPRHPGPPIHARVDHDDEFRRHLSHHPAVERDTGAPVSNVGHEHLVPGAVGMANHSARFRCSSSPTVWAAHISFRALLTAWAAAGYVVAAPLFPLSSSETPGGPDGGDIGNQPGDMSFVIDQMLKASSARTDPCPGSSNPMKSALRAIPTVPSPRWAWWPTTVVVTAGQGGGRDGRHDRRPGTWQLRPGGGATTARRPRHPRRARSLR